MIEIILLVLSIVGLEIILSLDNSAVLAIMVKDLPEKQRTKALTYGMLGAYLFRGTSLFFVSTVMQYTFIKAFGGLYLLYLTYDFFQKKHTPQAEDDLVQKESKWFYKATVGTFGVFWSTVIAVECMDMAFAVDSILAVVAFTNNLYAIIIGVFIGIMAIRFIAKKLVRLMEIYPNLETSAFVVIGLLGIKLVVSFIVDSYFTNSALHGWLNGHYTDAVFSMFTVLIFIVPIFWKSNVKQPLE
jgi:YkoY family integral membrane protein